MVIEGFNLRLLNEFSWLKTAVPAEIVFVIN